VDVVGPTYLPGIDWSLSFAYVLGDCPPVVFVAAWYALLLGFPDAFTNIAIPTKLQWGPGNVGPIT
jgi:hypothetical protein